MSSNPPLVDFVQEGLRTRRETLSEVVTGKKGLIERRLEIVDRRQTLFLESDSDPLNRTAEIQLNEESKNDNSNQGSSGVDPSQNVEVKVDSPTDEEIRAANNLSERYPGAQKVVLSDRVIEIHKTNGNVSSMKVDRMIQKE
ncbi:hypothetical protein [Halorubrum sp. FL23]|uniref:hypothetical protein n=1 Tax=Halorubrum sp. FL23 TaxID=3458704 RepID=UPI004033CDB3